MTGTYVVNACDVETYAIVPGNIQNTVNRARHIQRRGNPGLGQHLVGESAAEPGGRVDVKIDNPRHDMKTGRIEQLFGLSRIEIRSHFYDLAAFGQPDP